MGTVYNYDLHDVGASTFAKIQEQALREERGRILADQANELEAEARGIKAVEKRQALIARAHKLRKAAGSSANGQWWEGGVLAQRMDPTMADANPAAAAAALEQQAAALEAQAASVPEAVKAGLLQTALTLRTNAGALKANVSTPGFGDMWNSMPLALKAVVGVAAVGAGYAGYRWWSAK